MRKNGVNFKKHARAVLKCFDHPMKSQGFDFLKTKIIEFMQRGPKTEFSDLFALECDLSGRTEQKKDIFFQ